MSPVLDLKEIKETAMEASISKDHTSFVPIAKDIIIKPESMHNVKLNTGSSLNEPNLEICKNEDIEVDIINCTNDEIGDLVKSHSDDVTISSSSFDDTFNECESDNEVMSELRADGPSMRKKRVTSNWRKFVQPIMWRCKWVELQLRKFQSMAVKYDKEVEKHNKTNQLKYGNVELEGGCAKLIPFLHDSQREKPMKRKLRKRNDEVDKEMYMSQHNLFSFFATCRSPPNCPTMDDDQSNRAQPSDKNINNEFKAPDELLSFDFGDDYSLEQILWKIEVSQSRVSEMKTKLDTLTADNAGRIPSTEDLILHEANNNRSICSIEKSDFPTNMEGPSVFANFASQLMKLNTSDDLAVKSEIIASGQKDANEQPPVASRKRNTEGILIYNRRAKKLKTDSGDVKIHPFEKLEEPKEEKSNNTVLVSVSEDSTQNEQVAPKLWSVSKLTAPKNKKKRGARTRPKSGSSLWSRRA